MIPLQIAPAGLLGRYKGDARRPEGSSGWSAGSLTAAGLVAVTLLFEVVFQLIFRFVLSTVDLCAEVLWPNRALNELGV